MQLSSLTGCTHVITAVQGEYFLALLASVRSIMNSTSQAVFFHVIVTEDEFLFATELLSRPEVSGRYLALFGS